MVRSALARIPLPPSRLVVQPPGGRTLVNFDTNFYTERETFTRRLTLLGRRVTTRISPSAFTWHFGDGESRSTTTPGSSYPDLMVTHSYLQEGAYRPSVDTTYTAVFRIGSGPWQPVPGSVAITGPAVDLEAVEARPVLTAP